MCDTEAIKENRVYERAVTMQFRNLLTMSVLGVCAAGFVIAQDAQRPVQLAQKEKESGEKPEAQKPGAQKPGARMPNYFPKLSLTDQQREKILNTLVDYNEQIDELEDQIKELREKRDAEVRALLTAAQRDKLAEMEQDAKKKRAEKSASKKPTEPAAEEKKEPKSEEKK